MREQVLKDKQMELNKQIDDLRYHQQLVQQELDRLGNQQVQETQSQQNQVVRNTFHTSTSERSQSLVLPQSIHQSDRLANFDDDTESQVQVLLYNDQQHNYTNNKLELTAIEEMKVDSNIESDDFISQTQNHQNTLNKFKRMSSPIQKSQKMSNQQINGNVSEYRNIGKSGEKNSKMNQEELSSSNKKTRNSNLFTKPNTIQPTNDNDKILANSNKRLSIFLSQNSHRQSNQSTPQNQMIQVSTPTYHNHFFPITGSQQDGMRNEMLDMQNFSENDSQSQFTTMDNINNTNQQLINRITKNISNYQLQTTVTNFKTINRNRVCHKTSKQPKCQETIKKKDQQVTREMMAYNWMRVLFKIFLRLSKVQ
eukprot:403373541